MGIHVMHDVGETEVLERAREGDQQAVDLLFRRYRDAAVRQARRIVPPDEVEDVVAEAQLRVLRQLQAGGGPTVGFRPYLLAVVRNEAYDVLKHRQRVSPTDHEGVLDTPVPFGDGDLDRQESERIAAAFASLPKRWREVLWYLEVEGLRPREVAEVIDLNPSAVSALAYRARAALREAYLQAHVNAQAAPSSARCARTRSQLGAAVRQALPARRSKGVEAHLRDCPECTLVWEELFEVNHQVGAFLLPALPLVAAAGGLSVPSGVAGAVTLATGVAGTTELAKIGGGFLGLGGTGFSLGTTGGWLAAGVAASVVAGVAVTTVDLPHRSPTPAPAIAAVEPMLEQESPDLPLAEPATGTAGQQARGRRNLQTVAAATGTPRSLGGDAARSQDPQPTSPGVSRFQRPSYAVGDAGPIGGGDVVTWAGPIETTESQEQFDYDLFADLDGDGVDDDGLLRRTDEVLSVRVEQTVASSYDEPMVNCAGVVGYPGGRTVITVTERWIRRTEVWLNRDGSLRTVVTEFADEPDFAVLFVPGLPPIFCEDPETGEEMPGSGDWLALAEYLQIYGTLADDPAEDPADDPAEDPAEDPSSPVDEESTPTAEPDEPVEPVEADELVEPAEDEASEPTPAPLS